MTTDMIITQLPYGAFRRAGGASLTLHVTATLPPHLSPDELAALKTAAADAVRQVLQMDALRRRAGTSNYVTPDDIAACLSLPADAVEQAIADGRLPSIITPRGAYVRLGDVEQWHG